MKSICAPDVNHSLYFFPVVFPVHFVLEDNACRSPVRVYRTITLATVEFYVHHTAVFPIIMCYRLVSVIMVPAIPLIRGIISVPSCTSSIVVAASCILS